MNLQEYKRIDISKDEILPLAERMKKEGRYLVMIHGLINKDGQPDVIYCEAATWPERELNELFGFTFEGLDVSKRLFLPEDMLETQGKGQIMVTPLKELVEKNLGSAQPSEEVKA